MLDLGYLGAEKDFPEQLSALPYKKKRNQQELSAEEKEYNKIHSKKRIVIEHTICRLKKYRIHSEVFRNKLKRYNKVSDIVAGLVNYRIINQFIETDTAFIVKGQNISNYARDLFNSSIENPNELLFDEVWESKEVYNKHFQSQESIDLRAKLQDLVSKPTEFKIFKQIDGLYIM